MKKGKKVSTDLVDITKIKNKGKFMKQLQNEMQDEFQERVKGKIK